MTDARDYMISDERKAELDNEAAIADAKTALTAAGFRILGPDEVDPVSIENAVQVIEARLPLYTALGQRNAVKECASSIRAIASGGKP